MQRMFANAFKHFRVQHGLTQAVVAKRAGIAQSEVSRLEDGFHWPSFNTTRRLCKAIGVDEKTFCHFMANDILALPQEVWDGLNEDKEDEENERSYKHK